MKEKAFVLLTLSKSHSGFGFGLASIIDVKSETTDRSLFGLYFGRKLFRLYLLFITITIE